MEIVIVSIVLLVGVIYGYYTVSGSGIAEHPYGKVYGGRPWRPCSRKRLGPRRHHFHAELVARDALGGPTASPPIKIPGRPGTPRR